uniref:Integrase, catalytic region, zinc finger, CCHC-type, peptidase aspartic, catalytic n=1 Tax=Tanacetum cinerariifolium TaxID=118510 RepID=A0A699I4P9_TANCI|nr:integrase, catalytic region, zinc finger, CCHC-type, peptidase aspartic, catalytic [Tanacetum cinerariifolium]
MIPELGDTNREVHVNETFHVQTDDELTEKELKQIEADDQAIQTILLGLPKEVYATVNSCETAQEIWLQVQQMMKGSDIGIQENKPKLFNEWERFTSNEEESIKSYYHRFLKLMNDLKRNKHFSEKIASNLKFLNNLQLEWSRHVTIVHQTKDLHTADYTQLYGFLKYNQKEVDELKAERLAKIQDPLALTATSNNPYAFPAPHQDQPSFNQNYMQQPMPNPKDITDLTTAMNMALALMVKAFKLNYSTPTNNNQRISSNPRNRQIAQPGMNMGQDRQIQMVGGNGENQFRQYAGQNVGNLNGYNAVQNIENHNGNGNLVAARAEGNAAGYNGNQIRCYNYRGVGIQLKAKEFDLMAAAADLHEIKEVNANCILMANLQQASTSGTQTDKAPVYDLDGSAKVHDYENYKDNDIFNMFTQEAQYTELLEPNPKPHQVPHNDNNVISEVTSVEQSGETVEQHLANFEETRALYDSLYQNLAIELEKVNTVNRKLKETNADLTTELQDLKIKKSALKLVKKNMINLKDVINNDTTPSVARKFLNEVKSTIVTLQRVVKHRMTLETHNWSSSTHQELHKIVKDEVFPFVNQIDARVQNFEIQFLKEAAKFVGDFKSLAKEADESLTKNKASELEIECLFRAVVSQNIMSIVQKDFVVDTSNLQTELERTKESFENCIIKKENEYAKFWNDWYKKCCECKFDKILYDKAYNDMQQKIKWLQAQLGDLKGKIKDTSCVSTTLNLLSWKLENENVELEFQVLNYAKENAHLKTTYKNLFDSISVSRTQTKTIIASLQHELQNTIYENAKLRAQLFKKVSVKKDNSRGTSMKNKFAKQSILGKPPMLGEIHALSKPVTSNSVSTPQESKVVKNDKVIAPGMFRINPFKTSREEKHVPNNNIYSKVVCAMCKQCLISVNHDECLLNYVYDKNFRGTVRFENDHVAAILGFGDLQWGNILITRVYFVKGLGHNLFSVGQFCDSNLEVAFRRNECFARNLEGVDLLKGNRTTNLYTINLHDIV